MPRRLLKNQLLLKTKIDNHILNDSIKTLKYRFYQFQTFNGFLKSIIHVVSLADE